MSQNDKTLIVMFGGMAVSVVTTVCGAAAGFSRYFDSDEPGQYGLNWLFSAVYGVGIGGAIGAVVGMLIWGLLVYAFREKKSAELPPGPPTS